MKRRLALSTIAITAASVAPVALQPTPAHAAGWIGDCYTYVTSTSGGGWCDGNGPDWTYAGVAVCGESNTAFVGVRRWAGDRRKSSAGCPTTYGLARQGGVYVYFKGTFQYSWLRRR